MRTRAAVVWGRESAFEIAHVEVAEPTRDEVLVRITGCGICSLDLMVRDQLHPPRPPVILGHEGAGIVESVGPEVTGVRPGDHVVLTYSSCRRCGNCLSGAPAYCTDFFTRNLSGLCPDGLPTVTKDGERVNAGFFAQSSMAGYALARQDNVVVVPQDVPLELLGPLGCGVQAGAGVILNNLKPVAGSSVVIFGAGTVGLSALMAANAVGCTTMIVVDLKSNRLKLAQDLGATHIISGDESDLAALITDITGGGAQYAVETSAQPSVLRTAVDSLAVRGTCVLTGMSSIGAEVSLDISQLSWGRQVRGVLNGDGVPQIFIPQLIELRRQQLFPLDRLIDVYPFESVNQAVADLESGATVKPVLVM